ncbi:hypothetical protein [Huginn virus]|nr:hypothetical protein [Huginn virus]
MTETERLKGSVRLKLTLNLGHYNSKTYEISLEFFQDVTTWQLVMERLEQQLAEYLKNKGVSIQKTVEEAAKLLRGA